MRKFSLVFALFFLLISCHGKKVQTAKPPVVNLNETDKQLFERAMKDLQKSRFTVARLTLQTLINTYPDSEYLPPAKYALAESFYRENTTASQTQAEAEFKDYITFFPTSDLAADAQLKIALTHVRRMDSPDRDRTQAILAEAELKAMIENYPDSRLLEEAKQKLRGVQEVLAEGDNSIGNFYYQRKAYPAAMARYKEVMTKYPDYSKMPDTLYFLAESLRLTNNAPEAAIYYARIVTNHPLSARVSQAKQNLIAMNIPVPEPNPVALERAKAAIPVDDRGILGKVLDGFMYKSPVSTKTGAASTAADEEAATAVPATVRGGTGGSTSEGGSFGIESSAVQPEKKQTKNPGDDRGLFRKVLKDVLYKSPASTQPGTASSAGETQSGTASAADQEEASTAPTAVRGGTGATSSDSGFDTSVQPEKQPAKKLR
jgi:outer membrane protein assembly factor BamD